MKRKSRPAPEPLSRACGSATPASSRPTTDGLQMVDFSPSPPDPSPPRAAATPKESGRRGGGESGGWGEQNSPHPREIPPLPLRGSAGGGSQTPPPPPRNPPPPPGGLVGGEYRLGQEEGSGVGADSCSLPAKGEEGEWQNSGS